MFKFRELLLHEFQTGTMELSDHDLPEKTRVVFPRTWDFVTHKVVRKIEKLLTRDELVAVLGSVSFNTIQPNIKLCIEVIRQTNFLEKSA